MSTVPTPRKRVTQACKNCGVKKIKCDGIQPQCTNCLHRDLGCEYGESKRPNRARNYNNGSPYAHPSPLQANGSAEGMTNPLLTSNNSSSLNNDHNVRIRKHKSAIVSSALPPDISSRLFHLYFNNIHPLWPILYKPMYASLDYTLPFLMMPPALVSAIYAIASCIDRERPRPPTPNTIIQRYPEPRMFFEEALELLQLGSDRDQAPQAVNALLPSIDACQALVILSLQQHGLAQYSRAAILCGLASAMAIELRLHRPYESNDALQIEIRSRLWWNLFILEKMISCEMSRPILLRSEETDCPFPSTSEADEFELMSTYSRFQGRYAQTQNTSIKFRTLSGLHTTIRLSKIMERISREIYGLSARSAIRENQDLGESKRREIWSELNAWESRMDTSALALDLGENLTSVPAAITNYVMMYSGTILLHRPFITRWDPSQERGDPSSSPLNVCLSAANKIFLILEKYFDRLPGLPCDMAFSVFTAASTFLHYAKQIERDGGLDTKRRLKLCIHWLNVLGKSWKTAGARQQLLTDMFDMPPDIQQPVAGRAGPSDTVGDLSSPADWGFLRDFGDSTDDFYSLDEQLRGLLEGQFGSDSSSFI